MMTHVCNVRVNEKEDEFDYVERLFKEISVQDQEPIDYQCLQKYKKTNKHFNMTMIIEEGLHVAYQCTYHYETHEIKLNYDLVTETWKIESDKYEMEKTTYLNTILIDLEYLQQHDNLTLDQQIQFIIKEFDCYFLETDQTNSVKQKNAIDLHRTLSCICPPPIVPCYSQRNTPVVPSSFELVPIRQRRVIETILLHAEKKKSTFSRLINTLKRIEPITMFDLGLEFLRIYNGKFIYQEGHKFVLIFRKKTWYLTIEQIKYIHCSMNENGPKSILILHYKGQYTNVHV